MDFWNDVVTRKSWEVLRRLRKDYDFVVIGGWGIYLWVHAVKSRDVDIIISNWRDLERIKKEFNARKNDRLKKYEIVMEDVDVDIYVPYYSRLVIPCEDLLKMAVSREGFKTPKPEPLLVLKQQAYLERIDSIKGLKDRVDIMSLLINGVVDIDEYEKLIDRYGIFHYKDELEKIVRNSKEEFRYLGIDNPREISKLKKELLDLLKS